jgi:hypothetical protein
MSLDIRTSAQLPLISRLLTVKIRRRRFKRLQFVETLIRFKKLWNDLNSLRSPILLKYFRESEEDVTEEYNVQLNKSFSQLSSFINKKVVINIIRIFLNRFYDLAGHNPTISNKLTPQEFLFAYVVSGFPEIIFLKSKEQLIIDAEISFKDTMYNDIYILSSELVNIVETIVSMGGINSHVINKMLHQVTVYSNCFKLYSSEDKKIKLNELIEKWSETEKTKVQISQSKKYLVEQKDTVFEELNKGQSRTVKRILQIDPTFDPTNLKLISDHINKIYENVHKGYWDILIEDIKNEKYVVLVDRLIEIRSNLLSLCPNDSKTREEFDDNLDIDIIKQLIDSRMMSITTFDKYAHWIANKIIYCQAAANNTSTSKEWEEIKVNFYQQPFEDSIVKSFQFFLKEIEAIKNNIMGIIVAHRLGADVLSI